eukprot:74895-Rhodomonas_salina.1
MLAHLVHLLPQLLLLPAQTTHSVTTTVLRQPAALRAGNVRHCLSISRLWLSCFRDTALRCQCNLLWVFEGQSVASGANGCGFAHLARHAALEGLVMPFGCCNRWARCRLFCC